MISRLNCPLTGAQVSRKAISKAPTGAPLPRRDQAIAPPVPKPNRVEHSYIDSFI